MRNPVLILLIIFFALNTLAQERVYDANRLSGDSPKIDGIMGDSVWEMVSWEGEFIQREPYEGVAPTQKTRFKMLFDDNNLYVLIHALDTEPDKIEKRLVRRDNMQGDLIGIAVDSYFDKRTAFEFLVNPSGVKFDMRIANEDEMDFTWDPVWYVKTTIDSTGWVAEMRIPFTQLRFADTREHVWGLQVMRWIFRDEEFSCWKHIPVESSAWVSQFGELHGIHDIKPKKEVELIPYVMGSTERYEKEEDNPFATGKVYRANAGLDAKVAVTNDLTLNVTINPDFGQVEADPSEVNLTAFETFFEEKRPFFVEGANIYNFSLAPGDGPMSSDNLFYSRRIGRRPQHYPDVEDDEYVNQPEFTRILGAAKLSGKTRNGWSIGVLESVTNKETAEIDSYGERYDETVEPYTNYFNTRIQKDFNKGQTMLGGMFTATNRFINDSSVNFLPKAAYTGGLDFMNYWKGRAYYLQVRTAFSHVSGSEEAITDLQESPQRLYQRTNADHLSVDSSLKSLMGYGGTIEGGKIGQGHWRYGAFVTWRSPGIELNDQGYLRQSDIIQQVLWGGYRIWQPFSIFRSLNVNADQWTGWDFSGMNLYYGGNVNTNMQFKNYWSFGTGVSRGGKGINRAELRGGPAFWQPGNWGNWFFVSSDSRKKLNFEVGASNSWGDGKYNRNASVWLELLWRPLNSLQLSIEPRYQFGTRTIQYVETIEQTELPGGDRYVSARINSQCLSADIRINFSITPNLSIQFWGQPFIFAGEYDQFKNVDNAMAENFEDQYHVYTTDQISLDETDNIYNVDENLDGSVDYSFDNPDFNFYEFRSNLVLRWEYIPGSTLYVVYSQGRIGDQSYGTFNFQDDMDYLFDQSPHNVFLIKFSYRISL